MGLPGLRGFVSKGPCLPCPHTAQVPKKSFGEAPIRFTMVCTVLNFRRKGAACVAFKRSGLKTNPVAASKVRPCVI